MLEHRPVSDGSDAGIIRAIAHTDVELSLVFLFRRKFLKPGAISKRIGIDLFNCQRHCNSF